MTWEVITENHFVLMDAFNEQGMKKLILLFIVLFGIHPSIWAEDILSEDTINQIAQQFIDFHKTEDPHLLQDVLSPKLDVTISQGSTGFGFILNYNKVDYINYLKEGHKSRSRKGTDVNFISSEYLGNREAKIILRYRSKKLNRYVWVEALIRLEQDRANVTQIEEYT